MSNIYTEEELRILNEIKEKRSKLIDKIDSNEALANNPRMIEVYSGLLKDQEGMASTSARLRLAKKEVDNQGQVKMLVTNILQAVNNKQAAIPSSEISNGREVKTLNVDLVEGELSQDVRQFDMEEIEK